MYNNLGNYWSAAGRYDEAYEQLTHSARIVAANDPPGAPSRATAHENLALVAQAQGQRSKALRHFEQAEEVRRARLPEDHPDVMRVRSARARLLEDLGRDDEAHALMREVLRDQQHTLGPAHPDTLETSFGLASSLVEAGELEEGVALAEQSLQLAEAEHPGSDELGRWLVVMARIDHERQRYDEADHALTRALALLRFDTGESSPILSQAYMERGELALDRGDPAGAVEAFSTTISMYEDMFGKEHGRLGWPLSRRAEARLAGGDAEGARADLERAVGQIGSYEGPALQRPRLRFALAKLLPPGERGRALELVAEARRDLRAAREEAPPSILAAADELEAELAAFARRGTPWPSAPPEA